MSINLSIDMLFAFTSRINYMQLLGSIKKKQSCVLKKEKLSASSFLMLGNNELLGFFLLLELRTVCQFILVRVFW